jgi:hypothetical protein
MSIAILKKDESFTPTSDILLVSNQQNKERVKQFVEANFQTYYNAKVGDFLPNMLALLDSQWTIKASLGYQSALDAKLYLENYLTCSIEQTIADHLSVERPSRSQILEVGNLASGSPGATRRLILNLASHFEKQGFKWLVMTATPHVRNSFEKLNVGLNLHRVAKADAGAVANTDSHWGTYFDQKPQVYVGDISAGIRSLKANPVLSRLLERINDPVVDHQVRINYKEEVM